MPLLDQSDTIDRLYSLLPKGWFPDLADSPNLEAVLAMLGAAFDNTTGIKLFLDYVEQQSRISTADGFWLDLAAQDYFGTRLQRHAHEKDDNLRRRIILNLLAPRGTRPALSANVTNLTSFTPTIIELRNPGDCGSYSSVQNPVWGGAVYSQMGAYGTMTMPYQLLINVTRPPGEGIPLLNGYSMSGSGYATYPQPFGFVGANRPPANTWGISAYSELSDIIGMVTDQDIYSTIADTMPAGTIAWTGISSKFISSPPTGGGAMLDSNFFLDISQLAASTGIPQPGVQAIAAMSFPMFFHAKIFESDFSVLMKLPNLNFNANIMLVPPINVAISMTMPNFRWSASAIQIDNLALTGTIPISITPFTIYTTQTQPLLPSTMPFILGTVPNAQPLLGHSFVLGSTAPGIAGGVPLTEVTAFGHLGDMSISIPPQILSVSGAGVLGSTSISGVGLSSSFSLPATFSAGIAASLTPQAPANLPQTLPFQLGPSGTTQTNVSTNMPIVSSAAVLGTVSAISANMPAVGSAAQIGVIGVQTSQGQIWNAARKVSAIAISPDGRTASKASGSSADPVYAQKTATAGKYYWELTVNLSSASQITAGIASAAAAFSAGNYVGNDASGLGWQASSGNVLENNVVQAQWPVWTSTAPPPAPPTPTITGDTGVSVTMSFGGTQDIVTLCFALSLDDGYLWGRVGNGPWQGIVGSTGGGLLTMGVTPLGSLTGGGTGLSILGTTPLGTAIPGQTGGSSQPPNPVNLPDAPNLTSGVVAGTTVDLSWSASSSGLLIPASVLAGGVSPAVTLYTAGDSATGAFLPAQWQFAAPAGYGQW